MPGTILAQIGDSPAQAGANGIVAKLRKAISIKIPIGYQDETGFHKGVKPADKKPIGRWFWEKTKKARFHRVENSKICGNN
jgi:hypothetical protein